MAGQLGPQGPEGVVFDRGGLKRKLGSEVLELLKRNSASMTPS